MKEIKDINKWEHISCSWIRGINIKCAYYPKPYRFNVIHSNIPKVFFTEIKEAVLQFVQNHKGSLVAKQQVEKERSWKYHTSWFQIMLQNYRKKNSMVQKYNCKPIQENRDPRINSLDMQSTIFNRKQRTCSEEDNLFNNGAEKLDKWRTIKLDSCVTPFTKTNSKWLKDFNINFVL